MKNNKLIKISLASTLSLLLLQSCSAPSDKQVSSSHKNSASHTRSTYPTKTSDAIEKRVESLLGQMTLEQKIGQMLQPEIRSITPAEVGQFHIGSILNGGGAFPQNNKYASFQDWVDLADEFYWASMSIENGNLPIPVIWGTDAVHGHNNVFGATLFPQNIGLGAANNPDLVKKIAEITAKEVAVTGIDWTFAPTLAVARDDRWGRIYESYAEDPAIIKTYAKSMVNGLQGQGVNAFSKNHVLATAKHFVGDGGTQAGDDQGNTLLSEEALFELHGQGYFSALEANVQTVMVSYSSWNGVRMHGQKYLITDVLKNKMGFDGIVVSDWNGIGQVKGCQNDNCAAAINAGIDLFMVPDSWKSWIENTTAQVKSGEVSLARIDDAVSRILRVKLRTGLFDAGAPSTRLHAANADYIGSKENRDIAKQAVRESLVLLKNNQNILPLSTKANVLVAGHGADNIAMQNGGWTLSWQGDGNSNQDFPGATSILAGIKQTVESSGGTVNFNEQGHFAKKPDVAIVVVGEQPYTEYLGDIQNLNSLEFQAKDKKALSLLTSLKQQGIPVVTVLLSGRPLSMNQEINASDAFVAAWLPGSEGAGVAEVLFKNSQDEIYYDFSGRLSFSWPASDCQTSLNVGDSDYQPQFEYGYGLNYQTNVQLKDLPITDVSSFGCQLFEDPKAPLTPLTIDLSDKNWEVFLDSATGKHTPVASIATEKNITATVTSAQGEVQFTVENETTSTVSIRPSQNNPSPQLNLLPFLAQKGSLNWQVRIDKPLVSQVKAKIDCGLPCSGEVDISEPLKQAPVGQWHTLSIDLSCYLPGTDLSKVSSPLVISSDGPLSMSVAGGEIITNTNKPADIQCL